MRQTGGPNVGGAGPWHSLQSQHQLTILLHGVACERMSMHGLNMKRRGHDHCQGTACFLHITIHARHRIPVRRDSARCRARKVVSKARGCGGHGNRDGNGRLGNLMFQGPCMGPYNCHILLPLPICFKVPMQERE